MAVLGLRFCARAFSSCGKWGPLFTAVRGPLTITASLVAEHRLQTVLDIFENVFCHSRWLGLDQGVSQGACSVCAWQTQLEVLGQVTVCLRPFFKAFKKCLLRYKTQWSAQIFFLILFIFGCIGSSLLRAGFLQLQWAGATLRCGARASHCGGFSCCGARALGARASVVAALGLSSCGSWALERRLSSCDAWA